MKIGSKHILIGSQVLVILVFFTGMLLNYFSLMPIIDAGETAMITADLNEYVSSFYPDNGVNVRNKAQLDSAIATKSIPYGCDMIMMDGSGHIFFSSYGYTGNGVDAVADRYGTMAAELLELERNHPGQRSRLVFDSDKRYSYFACYEPPSDLLFFAVVDYRIFGSKMIRTFFILLTFMSVGGILIIIICYSTTRKILSQRHREIMAEKELETAASIQLAMMPRNERHLIQLDIDAKLVPARKVGGDFYCYQIEEGMLYFCIGDVSGKGVPASLFMSKAVTLFRSFANTHMSPSDIASHLNTEMCVNNHQNMFLTAIIGVMRLFDGQITYVNAGHELPVVWDGELNDKPYFLNTCGNIPLGVMNDSQYIEESIEISRRGFILFYTDGISEAKSAKKRYIEKKSILDIVDLVKTKSAKQINEGLLSTIMKFEEGVNQSDDIALLIFKNRPTSKRLVIQNSISDLRKLPPFLEEIFKEFCFDHKTQVAIRTGLDEALTNCVLYAYDNTGQKIELSADCDGICLYFEIKDKGRVFDPLTHSSANQNFEEEEEDLKVGGLGISIYKASFDAVRYSRDGEYNILKLIKKL